MDFYLTLIYNGEMRKLKQNINKCTSICISKDFALVVKRKSILATSVIVLICYRRCVGFDET